MTNGCAQHLFRPSFRLLLWPLLSGLLLGLLSLPKSFAARAPQAITGVKTVDIAEAVELYNQGAVFIDVRSREDWSIGHIDGAIHLDFESEFSRLYYVRNSHRDTPLVIYCDSADCLRSAYACAISVMWGFSKVYYFRSGFFTWMLHDYPIAMSLKQPFSDNYAIND